MTVALLGAGVAARADMYIQVNGTVSFASVPFGVWANVQLGDPALMVFAVPDQGSSIDPDHYMGYSVIADSFGMWIGDVAVGPRTPIDLFLANDYPRADSLVMGPDFIALGEPFYGLTFELHDSTGTVWDSPSLPCIPGTYPADAFDDKEWTVPMGGQNGIVLSVTKLIVTQLNNL